MKTLRQKMMDDMQLHGFAERTQYTYVEVVKRLSVHYHQPPEILEEEDVRNFFLHLIKVKKVSRATIKIYLCGIKFFYEKTLGRNWSFFGLILPPKQTRLPVVFSRDEVGRILARVHNVVIRG